MEIRAGMGGGLKEVTLSGNNHGSYRVHPGIFDRAAQDTIYAFSYRPQELLDLINDAFANRFFDLPPKVNERLVFESRGDSTYAAIGGGAVDVGSSTITVTIGDYQKSVEYSNGLGIAPLWLIESGNRIHLLAEYHTILGGRGGRDGDAGGD